MEAWPAHCRGIMSGLLQGAWGLGFLLASLIYGLLYTTIGWRGMLWVGILPAILCVFIRYFVKESEVWQENNRKRMEQLSLASACAGTARPGALAASLAGWLFGALAVAAILFYLLKMLAPIVLAGALEPKLLALLLDDKLLGVVAAGFTPFVLPNLAALLGVSIPTQLAIFRPPFL